MFQKNKIVEVKIIPNFGISTIGTDDKVEIVSMKSENKSESNQTKTESQGINITTNFDD